MNLLINRWLYHNQQSEVAGGEGAFDFVDFPCEVTGCLGHLQFTVRGDNGRAYKVHAAQYLVHLMGYHARVRISGSLKGGMVWAESIIPLGQNAARFNIAPAKGRH